jgi:hypothetical protein
MLWPRLCISQDDHRTPKPLPRPVFRWPSHRTYCVNISQFRSVLGFGICMEQETLRKAQGKTGITWVYGARVKRTALTGKPRERRQEAFTKEPSPRRLDHDVVIPREASEHPADGPAGGIPDACDQCTRARNAKQYEGTSRGADCPRRVEDVADVARRVDEDYVAARRPNDRYVVEGGA